MCHHGRQAGFAAGGLVRGDLLIGKLGPPPLPLVLDEDLEAVAADGRCRREGVMNPTGDGNVGAEAGTGFRGDGSGRMLDERPCRKSFHGSRLPQGRRIATWGFENRESILEKSAKESLTVMLVVIRYRAPTNRVAGHRDAVRGRSAL